MPVVEAVEENLVLINQWKGPRYQCVLDLFPFLTGAKWNGLIIQKCYVWCLCVFCIDLCRGWFCGFGGICGLMTCAQSGQRQTEVCF